MGIKEESAERLRRYNRELRSKRIRSLSSFAVLGVLVIVFGMGLYSGYLDSVLRAMGLGSFWNEERGVYTDCSRPENRDVKFCQPKTGSADAQWKNLRGNEGYMFSLGK